MPPASRRLPALLLTLGALLAALVAPAHGATPDVIVAKGSTVAGKGYSEWLGAWWRLRLSRTPDVTVCREVGDVAVLIGGQDADSGESDACAIPPGQDVYLNGPAVQCSTMQARSRRARTDRALKACARRGFARARHVKGTLDGKAIPGYASLATASQVVAVTLPRINVLKVRKRTGRVAAYGIGLLLRGLTSGTHVVRQQATFPGGVRMHLTYKVRVSALA